MMAVAYSNRNQAIPGSLPAPGAQGPTQLTTQWAGRMRGTAGHPEIAPLVRNQKESGGGRGWEPREHRGEKGGDGWLLGQTVLSGFFRNCPGASNSQSGADSVSELPDGF
ncbi:hypothetical protein NQZ68_001827 [Dissostichus eleginoides]|nr:hypothetical protein NQZ68_001827 [Dissostichus eleginoides]